MKFKVCLVFCALAVVTTAHSSPEKIPVRIHQAIVRSGLPMKSLGIVISKDEQDGLEEIYELNKNHKFIPASVTKLATAAAALNELSLSYHFSTQLLTDGYIDNGVLHGSLYFLGGGDPGFVSEACRAYPGKVAVGIDSRNDEVAVEGWSTKTNIKAHKLALQFEDVGVAALIYTDISRDGAMEGPNIEATMKLAETVNIPVILSGGVSSMDDLKVIKQVAGNSLNGLICGRAVYEGQIDVAKATKILAAE